MTNGTSTFDPTTLRKTANEPLRAAVSLGKEELLGHLSDLNQSGFSIPPELIDILLKTLGPLIVSWLMKPPPVPVIQPPALPPPAPTPVPTPTPTPVPTAYIKCDGGRLKLTGYAIG